MYIYPRRMGKSVSASLSENVGPALIDRSANPVLPESIGSCSDERQCLAIVRSAWCRHDDGHLHKDLCGACFQFCARRHDPCRARTHLSDSMSGRLRACAVIRRLLRERRGTVAVLPGREHAYPEPFFRAGNQCLRHRVDRRRR